MATRSTFDHFWRPAPLRRTVDLPQNVNCKVYSRVYIMAPIALWHRVLNFANALNGLFMRGQAPVNQKAEGRNVEDETASPVCGEAVIQANQKFVQHLVSPSAARRMARDPDELFQAFFSGSRAGFGFVLLSPAGGALGLKPEVGRREAVDR
jgi:hypothetical protein